jgi:hypothetical protein
MMLAASLMSIRKFAVSLSVEEIRDGWISPLADRKDGGADVHGEEEEDATGNNRIVSIR